MAAGKPVVGLCVVEIRSVRQNHSLIRPCADCRGTVWRYGESENFRTAKRTFVNLHFIQQPCERREVTRVSESQRIGGYRWRTRAGARNVQSTVNVNVSCAAAHHDRNVIPAANPKLATAEQ